MQNWKYILTEGASTLTLTNPPAGWDEKTISFIRHDFYNSVLRSLSLSLRFVKEGKDFLITSYDTSGVNAIVEVQIQRRDPQTDTFADYYTGIIDFSKIKITRDYCEVPIIDNAKLAKFIARDEIQVNTNTLKTIDDENITEFTAGFEQDVTIGRLDIIQQATWDGETIDVGDKQVIDATTNLAPSTVVELFVATSSFVYDYNEIGNDAQTDETTFLILDNTEAFDVWVKFIMDIQITGTISIPVNLGVVDGAIFLKVRLEVEDGPIVDVINYSEVIPAETDPINIDFDESYDSDQDELVPAGKKVFLKIMYGGGPYLNEDVIWDLVCDKMNLDIRKTIKTWDYLDRKCLLPHELFTRLLQKTTGPVVELDAEIIGRTDSEPDTYASDGEFSLTSLLSGYMVRDFTATDKPFTTSIRDFFKSLHAITPIGLWYDQANDKWVIDHISQFYKNTQIISIGEVANFERYVDEKYYHNTIKAGYSQKIEYENTNGLRNFNDSREYSNVINSIKNTLDIQSTYRADDYGISYLGLDTDKTKDNRSDNDIFWLQLKRDSGFKTKPSSDFEAIGGVLNVDYRLNVDITPRRNLNRHLSILAASLWKMTTKLIKYQKSQFNLAFTSKKVSASTVTELADVTVTTQPEYHPEVYNFSSPVTAAQITSLMADPHGYVAFTYLGVSYKGYILEVSTEPFNRKGNWTLIKTNPSK